MLLLNSRLFVLLAQLVGIGGQGGGLVGGLWNSSNGVRGWLQDFVSGRSDLAVGNLQVHAFEQDQNLFDTTALEAARIEVNLLESLAVSGRAHLSDRKTFGENAVVARSVKPFAAFHVFFILNVIDQRVVVSLALQRAPDVVLLRNDSRGKSRVGNQHYQRCGGVSIHHFANDSVGRNHRHAALHSAGGPAINEHHLGIGAGSIADYPRRDRLGRRLGLENTERLGAIGCAELGLEIVVFHLERAVVALQLFVFAAHTQQDEIVLDEAPGIAAHQFERRLDRRYRGNGPDAHQRDVIIGLDLIGNQQQLRHNHDQQNREVAVAAEEEVHTLQL